MAKTYEELKDNFFEEVGKVDLSKLGLGFGGLKDYAQLLQMMAEIPEGTKDNHYRSVLNDCCCDIHTFDTPRKSEQEVK